MAANAPEVQVLNDDGKTAVVKITGYYTSGDTSNTMVVNTAQLMFANTSQVCLVSLERLQYATDIANGAVQLYWEGTSNAAIFNFGAGTGGSFDIYATNNATGPTGNVGVRTINVGNGDTYSFILRLNKERGYANAYVGYNDGMFRP